MVVAISYVVAVVITLLLALTLYPIAGVFWVFGQCGKISVILLNFTKNTIRKLWDDIKHTHIVSDKEMAQNTQPGAPSSTTELSPAPDAVTTDAEGTTENGN